MYSKSELTNHLIHIGIKQTDTLVVHSSMKAIGQVENGADTVIDAFMEYIKDGLLIFPTHTWAQVNEEHNVFNPQTEPSCVGVLTNVFRTRPNVVRSLHPTHSVTAFGAEAAEYIMGEERCDTPCPRGGCWGRLYDRRAKILFMGCSLNRNTFLHSVEEWNAIPNRLSDTHYLLKIVMPDGTIADRPFRGQSSPVGDVSAHYGKMLDPFLSLGIAKKGLIGDAESYLCDAVGMADFTTKCLKLNPDLFIDDNPVPVDWYTGKVRDAVEE